MKQAVESGICSDVLYHESSRVLWVKCQELYNAGKNVDAVILAQALNGHEAFGARGVLVFLNSAMEAVPRIPHVNDYAEICLDMHRRRSLIELAKRLHATAKNVREPYVDNLRECVKELTAIGKESVR